METCDANHAWNVTENCSQSCQAGACTGAVQCSPGGTRCNGLRVEVCNSSGTAWLHSATCSVACSAGLCTGACTTQWLPVPAADPIRVEGIDRQLIGTLTRPDGTRQLTLAGWPLYGYAGDLMPGDTNGHARDGHFFAVTPIGTRAGPTPS